MTNKIIFAVILIIAAFLRFYGLNWDQDYHLHPDERMITMVAERIHLPKSQFELENILTKNSSLSPQFFAYGSMPIYLLKISGVLAGIINPDYSSYTSMNLVGRFLSALFDLGTLILLYLLGKKIFGKRVGIFASAFYALSVLPIQLAHFYAVDTPLTFFTLVCLYLLILFSEKANIKNSLLIGGSFGFALASKTSAVLLIVPIVLTFLLKKFLHPSLSFKRLVLLSSLSALTALSVFIMLEPFALIDFSRFWQQTKEQQMMTKDAFTFPYTLQYVGKVHYLYELKNIFFWGLGPILAVIAFIGTLHITRKTFYPHFKSDFLILVSFFWLYFGIVGNFAIGFMRYLLPIYPLLVLFGGAYLDEILNLLKRRHQLDFLLSRGILILVFLPTTVWAVSFINIYSQSNTRVEASFWIFQNIPLGSRLAEEHWDDGLPLKESSQYQITQLPLYDPDTRLKWIKIKQILTNSDYIIIASHRLYVPLQKLTDCPHLPPGRCYLQTANYYQKLFNHQLGFSKVAEFSSYPAIPFTNIRLDDFSADESFTVYDHPKIMIFKKDRFPSSQMLN